MIVDFQTHYTPPELMRESASKVRLDDRGNPIYFLNPLLTELTGRLAMMDRCGIDAQVLSCAAGFDRYMGRVRGLMQREKWGTAAIPRHNRAPRRPFDHYLEERLFFDCAGYSGPDHAAEWGAEWVGRGLTETALPQIVFASDYPQALSAHDEVEGFVKAIRALGPNARAMLEGETPLRLIPDLRSRLERAPR